MSAPVEKLTARSNTFWTWIGSTLGYFTTTWQKHPFSREMFKTQAILEIKCTAKATRVFTIRPSVNVGGNPTSKPKIARIWIRIRLQEFIVFFSLPSSIKRQGSAQKHWIAWGTEIREWVPLRVLNLELLIRVIAWLTSPTTLMCNSRDADYLLDWKLKKLHPSTRRRKPKLCWER